MEDPMLIATRNPVNSKVEVGSLPHYLRRVFYIPGGCLGFLYPSTELWGVKTTLSFIFGPFRGVIKVLVLEVLGTNCKEIRYVGSFAWMSQTNLPVAPVEVG